MSKPDGAPDLLFVRERLIKATRTAHVCLICRREMPAGSRAAYRVAMTSDDDRPYASYEHVLYSECLGKDEADELAGKTA